MPPLPTLEQTLSQRLAWNKARINFLAKGLLALITAKTVNLVELASVFPGWAQPDSSYKRLQRFLRFFSLSYAALARCVVGLLGLEPPWVLTLDRTEWYLGKTPLNVLTLGIAYKGVAFPLLWMVLPKTGNSNLQERKTLLEDFRRIFGTEAIAYLCADREFAGKAWVDYLRQQQIPFRLRIRKNTKVATAHGPVQVWRLFAALPLGQPLIFDRPCTLWGQSLYLGGLRLPDGDYLLVIAPQFSPTLLADYGQRWQIETLFGCLKSRGFRLEETHVTAPDRLGKLIALLALAFCWAHVVGEWLAQQKPIPIKKHGRLAKSIFRAGFDYLRHLLANITHKKQEFQRVIQLLSCT